MDADDDFDINRYLRGTIPLPKLIVKVRREGGRTVMDSWKREGASTRNMPANVATQSDEASTKT